MIDPGDEAHFRRFERIVSWKMNVQKENSSLVWAIWGTHDCSLPVKQIITDWSSGALSWRVSADVLKLLVNSFQCHFYGLVLCLRTFLFNLTGRKPGLELLDSLT